MKKLIVLIAALAATAGIARAQQQVTLDLTLAPAEEIFRQVERQSGYVIYCRPDETDTLRLTVRCTNERPEVALRKAFEGTPFAVSVFGSSFIAVLKDRRLTTSLPEGYFDHRRPESAATGYAARQTDQKATSGNKVYVVGSEQQGANRSGRMQLTGVITDFRSGEPITGAVIYTDRDSTAATTGATGDYTLSLSSGRQTLHIRGIGIKQTKREIAIYESGRLDIEMEEEVYALTEVTITSERMARIQSVTLGVEHIRIRDIKNIPTSFGESDVIKAIMMLPGVKSAGEASSGINVRGGATDQNLILFNDGTIYNPTHLFGVLSAFNPDVLRDMELYKSSIPAKYGGRISSVLAINSREGSSEKITGTASLGLLTSRLSLEGPAGAKTTWLVGARTTYSDWMLSLLSDKSGYRDGSAGFYDANATIAHRFDSRNQLSLNGYFSRDRFSFNGEEDYSYRNANASMKWRRSFSDMSTGALTAGYDHYSYNMTSDYNPAEAYKLRFGIDQGYARLDFTSYLSDRHTLDFGAGTIYYSLMPGEYLPGAPESLMLPDRIQTENALESSVYIADLWNITPDLSVNAGIRYTLFNVLGPRTWNVYDRDHLPSLSTLAGTETVDGRSDVVRTYHAPDFRLSLRYAIRPDLSFKAGVNTLQQNIHKLSNTTIMSPTDTWKLSDANIRPQKGMQVAAGFYRNFLDNTVETSIEGYYKTTDNYLDYRGGAQLMMNHHIETDVISTGGKAYGVELMVKKATGKLNGWVGYSYSRSMLRQDNPLVEKPVNSGNWYPADYDKPHEFKFAGNYKFTQRYSFSLNCDYSTGRPITLPAAKYDYMGGEYVYYSERNQYRIPDFFRMDCSFNIEPTHHLTVLTHSTISLGVYNITGRKNAYSVYYIAEDGRLNGYMMSIFGAPIPYLSYNIRF
jgi:hypothetical protein